MPKPPAIPGHLTQAEFGQTVMRWGTGDSSARARIQTMTRVELERQGITAQTAREWRDFYRQEVRRSPANPSAKGCADLMQHALEPLEDSNEG